MTDWLVAVVDRPARTVVGLIERGFCCYYPKFRVKQVVRGQKTWRESFFLGRYVLIQLQMKLVDLVGVVSDWARQFHKIVKTPGVHGILSADGQPLLARSREVDRLRALEQSGYLPAPRFATIIPGQRVFIKKGALVDMTASFKFTNGSFDYVDLDGLLGRTTTVKLVSGLLVPAG